jgi:DNA adenine methylase
MTGTTALKKMRIKPIVKWAGGKSQLITALLDKTPDDFNDYYEPFFGSGAYFFALNPDGNVFINDINKTLMNLYRIAKENPEELTDKLRIIQEEYNSLFDEKKSDYYYEKRKLFNTLEHHDTERIALFVFLNKTGYNGMYRESSDGSYNIPFGKQKTASLINNGDLLKLSERLAKAKITDGDYLKVIDNAKMGDFIYLDPPYHPVTRTANFTSYNKNDFGEKDQIKLAKAISKLTKRGCKIMLSNSDADFIKDLYKDFYIYEVEANRFINCKAESRGKVKELIIANYK